MKPKTVEDLRTLLNNKQLVGGFQQHISNNCDLVIELADDQRYKVMNITHNAFDRELVFTIE